MAIDMFSKMTHLISCYKTDDTINIADLFFREIVWIHMVHISIVFSIVMLNFLTTFKRFYRGKLRRKILFSTTFHP
jgi:hypothetical protein